MEKAIEENIEKTIIILCKTTYRCDNIMILI